MCSFWWCNFFCFPSDVISANVINNIVWEKYYWLNTCLKYCLQEVNIFAWNLAAGKQSCELFHTQRGGTYFVNLPLLSAKETKGNKVKFIYNNLEKKKKTHKKHTQKKQDKTKKEEKNIYTYNIPTVPTHLSTYLPSYTYMYLPMYLHTYLPSYLPIYKQKQNKKVQVNSLTWNSPIYMPIKLKLIVPV